MRSTAGRRTLAATTLTMKTLVQQLQRGRLWLQSLWQGPSKSQLSFRPLDHAESEIASEWRHHTFRRKSRMHLSTITMISLLGPTVVLERRKYKATEFRLLRISFPNFEPRVYAQTVLL